MADRTKILAFIQNCEDREQLKTLLERAKEQGETEVADAAFRKLIGLVPEARPGTVEHDLWTTIHAFEQLLSEERGRTTRLSRTRQKVARVGEHQTLADWARDSKPTQGFEMLVERGMPELTGEAIVLRHADKFDHEAVAAARKKLLAVDYNPDRR